MGRYLKFGLDRILVLTDSTVYAYLSFTLQVKWKYTEVRDIIYDSKMGKKNSGEP